MDDDKIIGQCFNFSTDTPFNVIQLVDLILEQMNMKHLTPIIQDQASNEIPEQHLCSDKAKNILGWQAKWGVKTGLLETIEWYKKFLENKVHDSSLKIKRCSSSFEESVLLEEGVALDCDFENGQI